MRSQFYHAIALCALIAPACGQPSSNTPAPAATRAIPPPAPVTDLSSTSTPTADAVRRGKEIIERVRAAAGGPKLTALRSFAATGTSTMSAMPGIRTFSARALYPGFYRQEEIPTAKGGLGVVIGIEDSGIGWMLGARIGGGSRENSGKILQETYNRSASQAMTALLAGVNAPWLLDSGKFVAVASPALSGGEDRSPIIVTLEGPHGRAGRLLIDPATHLPIRFIEPPQPGTAGEAGRNELDFVYNDYRRVDGVMLPHTIVRHVGRIQTTWAIAQYTINPKLKPLEFTRRYAAKVK